MTNLHSILKKQRYHFADKGTYSQCYGFSSSHVQTWELGHTKGWELKNWCFRIVVLKTLDSPLDSKDIKPVNTKGNQPWIFIRTVARAPIHWPPMQSRLIGKDADTGKDWKQKEKGVAENEVVREHHQLNGHESEQTLGDNGAQRSLACCSPWGRKKSDMT